jgi:murein endopeptidase/nucleoid-associated protein YgaU
MSLPVLALVVVLAAGGGVATALFVIPRATGALRAVTAASVYADPDEVDPPAEGAEPGEGVTAEGAPKAPVEPEIPVGDAAPEPIDPDHALEQALALDPAPVSAKAKAKAKARKIPVNAPIVLEGFEIEMIEGSRPWVIHRLVPLETLDQVAHRYEVTPDAVRTWNGLAATVEQLEADARVKLEAGRVPPPRQQVEYTVQPGDTWWSIAVAHAIDSRQLRAANSAGPARLSVGQTLTLWIDPAVYHWVQTDIPAGDGPLTSIRRGAVGVGLPWDGWLVNGVQIPRGKGWRLQLPGSSYGTSHAVVQLVAALQAFGETSGYERALLLGSMSLPHGGPLPGHGSHQTGRDLDIRLPLTADNPPWFPIKPWRVDYEALWRLVEALADTGEIEAVFLDYELQKGLHKAATKLGADQDALHRLIQWPRGRAEGEGLVRHAGGQLGQIHVRFRCGRHETECVSGDASQLDGG